MEQYVRWKRKRTRLNQVHHSKYMEIMGSIQSDVVNFVLVYLSILIKLVL